MTAGATRTFHVVTQRRWMVEELTAGLTPAGWTVQAHHGLSGLPPQVGIDPDHVLWAPQAFAARALFSGSPLRLSSPGPRWLTGLWLNDLAREVVLLTVEVAAARRPGRVSGSWPRPNGTGSRPGGAPRRS